MTVINIDMPRIIPKTDIFDMIFMKLELFFDRKNLYANNNRIKILYHRALMNQANITQVRLLNDYDSNGIVLAWPSLYEDKPYWLGMLEVYYQLITDCLQNKKHIILVTKKNRSIEDDLKCIKRNIDSFIKEKKYFTLYEIDYDDIWLRDIGPIMLKMKPHEYNFNVMKFNGYGDKYIYKNDKIFSKEFIEKFASGTFNNKTSLEIFEDLVIEPGNIVYDDELCMVNKRPLIKHNSMTWNQINKILTNGFQNILNKKFIIIDVGVLSGDDTDGHIDNLVRLDQPNVLYFMATDDKSHPDYELLKDLKNQISNNNFGKRKIIPINHNLTDIVKNNVNEILPFSYLNYIRIGKIIYIPINKFTNERKKIEIRNIFKNSNVRFILCNSLLNEKGGLHCFSMNIIKDKEI